MNYPDPAVQYSHAPFGVQVLLNWAADGFEAIEVDIGSAGYITSLIARMDPTLNGGGTNPKVTLWLASSPLAPTTTPTDEDSFLKLVDEHLNHGHATTAAIIQSYADLGAPYVQKEGPLWLVGSLTGATGAVKLTVFLQGHK